MSNQPISATEWPDAIARARQLWPYHVQNLYGTEIAVPKDWPPESIARAFERDDYEEVSSIVKAFGDFLVPCLAPEGGLYYTRFRDMNFDRDMPAAGRLLEGLELTARTLHEDFRTFMDEMPAGVLAALKDQPDLTVSEAYERAGVELPARWANYQVRVPN